MTMQALDYLDFLAERREGIGGTDAPAILGVSRWASPFDVYMNKTEEGDPEPDEPSLPMWLGKELQSTVGKLYSERTGIRVRAAEKTRVHKQFRWHRCHLDFTEWGNPKHLIEAKTTSDWDAWGKQGTMEIPAEYFVQVQHEMSVTGADTCTVATLFGLKDFRWYEIPRDDEFIRKMFAAEEEFWNLHVVPRNPPPIDGSAAARRFLRRREPVDNGVVRPATPEQEMFVERYRMARHNLAAIGETVATLENQIIDLIGADAGLQGSDFVVTYKKVKDSKRTGWKEVCGFWERVLEAMPRSALEEAFRSAGFSGMPLEQVAIAIQNLYVTEVKGERRIYWKDLRKEVD